MPTGVSSRSGGAPPGAISRQALAQAFVDCAKALQETHNARGDSPPDASSLRELQDYIQDFVDAEAVADDVRYSAFIVDMLIRDAFGNFFGDLIHSKIADEARAEACMQFATLFIEMAAAVRDNGLSAQAAATKQFVCSYLAIVRRLNAAFVEGTESKGE